MSELLNQDEIDALLETMARESAKSKGKASEKDEQHAMLIQISKEQVKVLTQLKELQDRYEQLQNAKELLADKEMLRKLKQLQDVVNSIGE